MLFFFISSGDPCHPVSQCLVASAVCPGYLSSSSKHKFEGVVNVSSGLLTRCKFYITDCVVPTLDHWRVLSPIDLWLISLVSKHINQTRDNPLWLCGIQCCTLGMFHYNSDQINVFQSKCNEYLV